MEMDAVNLNSITKVLQKSTAPCTKCKIGVLAVKLARAFLDVLH